MKQLKMKGYNRILIKKQQNYRQYHQVKSMSMNTSHVESI